MPKWEPGQEWLGEDVYVVGGGTSLATFDWELIRNENTIGCNSSAIVPGSPYIKKCLFGDYAWWYHIGSKEGLDYGGEWVACTGQNHRVEEPYVLLLDRHEKNYGLGTVYPAFNGNTGAMAINLALILGARRVFLLGMDMQMGWEGDRAGQPNYHDVRYQRGNEDVYPRMQREVEKMNALLRKVFPGREVINVSDCSMLTCFPKVAVAEHFKKGKQT